MRTRASARDDNCRGRTPPPCFAGASEKLSLERLLTLNQRLALLAYATLVALGAQFVLQRDALPQDGVFSPPRAHRRASGVSVGAGRSLYLNMNDES